MEVLCALYLFGGIFLDISKVTLLQVPWVLPFLPTRSMDTSTSSTIIATLLLGMDPTSACTTSLLDEFYYGATTNNDSAAIISTTFASRVRKVRSGLIQPYVLTTTIQLLKCNASHGYSWCLMKYLLSQCSLVMLG
jgi:hypothetical protein